MYVTFKLVLNFSVDTRSTFFMQLYCSFYSLLFSKIIVGVQNESEISWQLLLLLLFWDSPVYCMFFLETKPCPFINLLAYKCRCTRKGPKIRYKDVQKLEIKPKHPYCQEKMILWVGKISIFYFLVLGL